MKYKISTLFIITLLLSCKAINLNKSSYISEVKYLYEVNIQQLKDDKLNVNLEIQGELPTNVTYCFPKIVPGIYGAMDFGQDIVSFDAVDEKGNKLQVKKAGINCWEIKGAEKLRKINYEVNDGWEVFDLNMERGVYRSASSSFKDDAYIINTNCLFGYFKDFTDKQFQVTFNKPSNFYAATGLNPHLSQANQDVFITKGYHELVDHPIMYSKPDTTIIKLPNIEVEVACFSTSGQSISKEIANYIKPLLINQTSYLGNSLPLDNYTFIIFHNLNPKEDYHIGDGLEHNNSTLILLYTPLDLETIKQNVYGMASHEFFHTLMPLGLHSHEIEDYDFNEPKFSKHLWLYEGTTEYFTIHMPIKNGVQSFDEFTQVLEGKIQETKEYDPNLSMTKLSLNPINLQDQYYSVYSKGALLNLCLDIKLRELSGGKYGVQNLVLELVDKYGADKPFEDEELFDEIVAITGFDEIKVFIEKYIENTNELPLKEMLSKVGLNLENDKIISVENPTTEQQQLRKSWLN